MDDDQRIRHEAALHEDAEFLHRLSGALAPMLSAAAAMIQAALRAGGTISVCGNRASGALVAAAGLPYSVYLPPGRTGDLMLVIMPEAPPDDLVGMVAAGRGRGLLALAFLSEASASLAAYTDLALIMPTADLGAARLAIVAVLRAITYTALP